MKLAEARQDYLDHLAERNRSPVSIRTYAAAIDRFLAFLQPELPATQPVHDLRVEHLRRYARHLFHEGLAVRSRSTYLVVLRNWLRYLLRRGECEISPDQIELPRNPESVPHPDERIPLMLSAPLAHGDGLIPRRDQAILETLFSTQLRVSELVGLDRQTIDWERGIAVVVGKGRRVRTVFFSERSLAALRAYLELRGDDFNPLFIHHDRANRAEKRYDKFGQHMRLSRQSVETIVRKYARQVGVVATPHSFRHYGATELLRNGADIRTVQELLGHRSVSTTQIYTHVAPRRLEQAWRRFHPSAALPPAAGPAAAKPDDSTDAPETRRSA